MPDTTHYIIEIPAVGASVDTWGTIANAAFSAFDTQLFRVEGLIGGKIDKAGGTFTGAVVGTTANFQSQVTSPTFIGALTGNAATATKFATARTISFAGVITGSGVFDGTDNLSITTSVADGGLTIAKTSGLQAALDTIPPALNADQTRKITYGTAAPSGTPADGDIYLRYDA